MVGRMDLRLQLLGTATTWMRRFPQLLCSDKQDMVGRAVDEVPAQRIDCHHAGTPHLPAYPLAPGCPPTLFAHRPKMCHLNAANTGVFVPCFTDGRLMQQANSGLTIARSFTTDPGGTGVRRTENCNLPTNHQLQNNPMPNPANRSAIAIIRTPVQGPPSPQQRRAGLDVLAMRLCKPSQHAACLRQSEAEAGPGVVVRWHPRLGFRPLTARLPSRLDVLTTLLLLPKMHLCP